MQETWNNLIGEYNKIIDELDFTSLIREIKEYQEPK